MLSNNSLAKHSKWLSFVLRHNPEAEGIVLDPNGWAMTQDILKVRGIELADLQDIVSEDSKGRYSFNEDQTKIRANQGHSLKTVDLQLPNAHPPIVLFHGTAKANIPSIKREGILPMSRQHVHLSSDLETALKVGERHGEPTVMLVDTLKMYCDGIPFFISENNVWLTYKVDTKYIIEFDALHEKI